MEEKIEQIVNTEPDVLAYKDLKEGDKLFVTFIKETLELNDSCQYTPIVSILEVSVVQKSEVFLRVRSESDNKVTFSILVTPSTLPVNGSEVKISDADSFFPESSGMVSVTFEDYSSAVKYCSERLSQFDSFINREIEQFRHKYGKKYLSLTNELRRKFDNAFEQFSETHGYTFTDSSYYALKDFYYYTILGNSKGEISEKAFSPGERYDNETKLFAEYVWREKIELKDL